VIHGSQTATDKSTDYEIRYFHQNPEWMNEFLNSDQLLNVVPKRQPGLRKYATSTAPSFSASSKENLLGGLAPPYHRADQWHYIENLSNDTVPNYTLITTNHQALFIYNRTKIAGDFRCFRSKMCFRTFSTVPLNSPMTMTGSVMAGTVYGL